jgi:ribonuclease D
VEKVFHAAAYDVLSLHRDYGFSFRNLFDTHLAAQLLGYEQLGLDVLLESLLGVVHSKRRQRDDWSRRPLEPEQLQYAAMDTHHLLRLRDLLETRLRAKGRLLWAQEEFQHAAEPPAQEKQFDPEGYLRIKGIRVLGPKELAVLRALYLLRDRYARTLDIPPFKVINNSVLLNLAQKPPASPAELYKRPGISYRVARKFSGEIYRTISKAKHGQLAFQRPSTRTPCKQPSTDARNRLERLKSWRQVQARVLDLPVGVIFPGNLLDLLAVSPPGDQAALEAMEGMRHWRVRAFGPEILSILNSG